MRNELIAADDFVLVLPAFKFSTYEADGSFTSMCFKRLAFGTERPALTCWKQWR